MKQLVIAFACVALITSCGTTKNVNQSKSNKMNSIFEIAINQSKDGRHQSFLDTREKFVDVLGEESATLNEGKWQPFFTVAPDSAVLSLGIRTSESLMITTFRR